MSLNSGFLGFKEPSLPLSFGGFIRRSMACEGAAWRQLASVVLDGDQTVPKLGGFHRCLFGFLENHKVIALHQIFWPWGGSHGGGAQSEGRGWRGSIGGNLEA